jgi:hypothetical protein
LSSNTLSSAAPTLVGSAPFFSSRGSKTRVAHPVPQVVPKSRYNMGSGATERGHGLRRINEQY